MSLEEKLDRILPLLELIGEAMREKLKKAITKNTIVRKPEDMPKNKKTLYGLFKESINYNIENFYDKISVKKYKHKQTKEIVTKAKIISELFKQHKKNKTDIYLKTIEDKKVIDEIFEKNMSEYIKKHKEEYERYLNKKRIVSAYSKLERLKTEYPEFNL